jgi:peptide subunit release factor 1 (eRF1)
MESIDEIEAFKYNQQLDLVEKAVGSGTSLVTLLIPGTMTQLHRMKQRLYSEKSAASNIKDPANRDSV